MDAPRARQTYWLTRFVLLRLLGVIYVIAFLAAVQQLAPQTCRADSAPELISLGHIKAVTFPETLSADRHYVIAWTLLPRNKERPPFDWSGWSSSAPRAPLEKFGWGPPDPKTAPYVLHDIFIDLVHKRWADLPSDLPTFSGKGFGPPTLLCEPSPHGAMHALVQNPGHFGSLDLWLVTVGNAISVCDETRAANNAVDKLLLAKYGKLNGGQTWFEIDSQENPDGVFSTDAVEIDFDTGTERESTLTGMLTIRLADGKIIAAKAD